jgi:hypothetical protein
VKGTPSALGTQSSRRPVRPVYGPERPPVEKGSGQTTKVKPPDKEKTFKEVFLKDKPTVVDKTNQAARILE